MKDNKYKVAQIALAAGVSIDAVYQAVHREGKKVGKSMKDSDWWFDVKIKGKTCREWLEKKNEKLDV